MTGSDEQGAGRRRPNILLIVSDDHGYADRGAGVATPTLDRLAAEGVTCSEAYVSAPICSPSRAGMITGQHQARWGARWFESSTFAPQGIRTLAEHLKERAYATGYFGKVHYGTSDAPGSRSCPPHHGFDESFYGLAHSHAGRLNYLRRGRADASAYGAAAGYMGVGTLWEGDDEVAPPGFLTDLIADRAQHFIGEHADEPWFAMVAFNAVHNFCWQLPAEELQRRGLPPHDDWDAAGQPYLEWYDDAIAPHLEHGREYYLAQLELMDAAIGRLLATLAERGIAEDTIVVYLTDNGGSPCNFGDNTPLRGTKYTLWEGGIRVPFLVRWPGGGVPGGEVRAGLVSSLDLVPTLVAATGEPLRETTDGLDQWTLLRGARGEQPRNEASAASGRDIDASACGPMASAPQGVGHEELHWSTGWAWAVRRGEWKLSYVEPENSAAAELTAVEHAPLGSGLFLANLAADPSETTDRAADRPDVVTDLTRRHEAWEAGLALSSGQGARGPWRRTGGVGNR